MAEQRTTTASTRTPVGDGRRAPAAPVSLLERLRHALAGRYAVDRELGRGGMAAVVLAEDLKHKRPVAIKVLNPEIARLVGPDRFLREIEIAARLTHPHILPVFDSGNADGLLYYVMPYVRGESLRHRLDRAGPLTVAAATRIAREVADALDYAHRQGYVHRDVKPENVLLEDGHAFVADFGVARALEAGGGGPKLTDAGLAIGTPYYMSPEQATGEGVVDGRADLYALGCVFYEMLAGRPVFEGATAEALARQHLFDTPRRLRSLRRDVPPTLEEVIHRALAKLPSERWRTGAEIAAALDSGTVPVLQATRRRQWIGAAAVAVAVAIGAAVASVRRDRALDADLVAVAPFDVLDADLQLWREGLVDVVSRDLDGAGPLRTVAPTIVVRRWSGRADVASAAELGRQTGAGLIVIGHVVSTGGDSVRLSATLFDAAARRPLSEFVVRDVGERMDRVADSLAIQLLRALGQTRPIGAVRLASIGSTSMPALRAFLRGEQFYRLTDWDSAITYYERAIALDSGFALAWKRVGTALGWQRAGADTLARYYHDRAGMLNHRLAPRDSLLITADSLASAMYAGVRDTLWYVHGRRLFATVEEATRRYPEDPEAWYALGEVRYHFPFVPGTPATPRSAREAFDRAIALDSAFGPAYIHPVDLALRTDGSEAAGRYIQPYLALQPRDVNAAGIRILAQLIAPRARDAPETQRLLDTVSLGALRHAIIGGLAQWLDTGETLLHLLERTEPRWRATADSATMRRNRTVFLAFRGHLREAATDLDGADPALHYALGIAGTLPADSVDQLFVGHRENRRGSFFGSAWWASRGDVASLIDWSRYRDSLARQPPRPYLAGVYRYDAAATRAYLTLARRDTADALRQFTALPDSACPWCVLPALTRAELLAAVGRDRDAAADLDRHFGMGDAVHVWWALLRGHVSERLGDRTRAIESYEFVVRAWHHADVELQPFVTDARAGLARLATEREPRS